MSKKKNKSFLVMLLSTAKNKYGNPTGTFFVRHRDPKKNPNKLLFTKFDPLAFDVKTGKIGFHVEFKEHKMPPHAK